jgi:hypothetical protein
MLSKHFAEQRAGTTRPTPRAGGESSESA